ncbi:MAG: hypothetical protein KA120_08985 [Candidatus Goldbacteria bacterium]|nr:hypothetical protein [Candidatus Goldiibacteriota bacterium]HPD18570.1 hypothetical protein [Candidatus Goldiibacteriota bacterium]
METSTRMLALISEFIMVPVEIQEKKHRLIFDRISDTHSIGSYTSLADGSIQMVSKSQKTNVTRYIIMKDRIVLSYEFCENSLNYYLGQMDDFYRVFYEETNINTFLMHSITIRKLVNLSGIEDSRKFMLEKVFSIKSENLQCFEKPLHMFGTRLFFPGTTDNNTAFDIRIETVMDDFKTFFIENKGIFPQPVDINRNAAIISDNIKAVDDFINRNIINFLTQFI